MVSVSKSDYVKTLFQNIAPVYDLLNNVISFCLHKKWKSIAVKQLEVKPSDKVLDLCTGTGDIAEIILRNYNDIELVAVDFSEEMLKKAQKKLKKYKNLTLLQADAMSLPFSDNEFDCVIISFGLRNLESISCGLQEMIRVLKPGGKFVNIDFGKPESRFIRFLFEQYFAKFVPIAGKFLGKYHEYAYLPCSISKFLSPDEIISEMIKVDFKKAYKINLFAGFVSVQSAIK